MPNQVAYTEMEGCYFRKTQGKVCNRMLIRIAHPPRISYCDPKLRPKKHQIPETLKKLLNQLCHLQSSQGFEFLEYGEQVRKTFPFFMKPSKGVLKESLKHQKFLH